MPPRRNIIKSGNAGTSKTRKQASQAAVEGEQSLFPPGSKYPLSLLHERCQKMGWEKPSVETRQVLGGWSFVVHLSRMNKKTGGSETVRLEPKPPHLSPSSIEARHWGATYALYRFCNGMQLHLVLPTGPKEYWNQLAAEHKSAPSHLKWLYDNDPFAAREKEVSRHKGREQPGPSSNVMQTASNEFSQAPEVKMAMSFRALAEDAIKKGFALFPEVHDHFASPSISQADVVKINQQLNHLGFKPIQSDKALQFISTPSPFVSALLDSSSELEACIEYLLLHTPECDLPKRFLPSSNSSNPFITSVHSGTDDLQRRWVEDKAVKEAGWPSHVVKACLADPGLLQNWDRLIFALGKVLLGEEWNNDSVLNAMAYNLDADELEALGIASSDPEQLVMPLFSAPIDVHILFSSEKGYPQPGYAPIYLTSTTVPPYIRLHLLSQTLVAIQSDSFIQVGEGFCMALMRFLEGEWAKIEDDGPPEMSIVLRNLQAVQFERNPSKPSSTTIRSNTRRHHKLGTHDQRNNQVIKEEFQSLSCTKEYLEMLAFRRSLPAFLSKESFLKQLEENRVVIVVGETGSGKTTQLPQFILDALILSERGSTASILVTQPRRISAITVAARVSAERLDDGSVGYAIRGESKRDPKTKLLFCTTGVVLRRLGTGDDLKDISHVVVDEVHERSVDSDFLLIQLKDLLERHKHLKIILMSATINHEILVKYFNGAPLLTIPGHTHPVSDRYLEDVIGHLNYTPTGQRTGKGKEKISQYQHLGLDEISLNKLRNIISSDRIDYQLIAAVVEHIMSTADTRGGILIFLPGAQEIQRCIEAIRLCVGNEPADIFPLHANLTSDEQRRVFLKTTKWKIVAATNVAETSITIDDIIYVLDTGKFKETQYDPETSLSRLVETWITQAVARQRRGRAGRTQPGICYKLYTRKQESNMDKFPVPEILRVPLESILLTVKVTREGEDVKSFLSRAIDPPKIQAIEEASSVLRELGAVDDSDNLTPLGRHMAMLPVDLRLGKMLILGTIFRCLGPVLTIAAILSSKPIFLSPMDKHEEASKTRSRFAAGGSDLLTDVKAYDECMKLRSEGKSQSELRWFCEENFISASTVREITTLRMEFFQSLSDLGFVPVSCTPSSPLVNDNSRNTNLLKAVILGGLWPRVARVHLPRTAIKFDKVQAGTVQRESMAREFKMYDMRGERVFLHPASVLFGEASWKSPFLVYFHKYMSSKVFLRDATEVPMYGLLLFGGPVSVDHIKGGLTIGSKKNFIRLKAWPRIGVLVNQLRRLLDAQLERCIENGTTLSEGGSRHALDAMLALLTRDGMTE